MKKLINDLREGYYFLQLRINDNATALHQARNVFKYTFIGYFIALIAFIVGLIGMKYPIKFQKNIFLSFFVGALVIYVYKIIFDFFFNDMLDEEINIKGDQVSSGRKIRLYVFAFLMSLASIGLSMLLLSVIK